MINGNIQDLADYIPESIRELVMTYVNGLSLESEEGFTYLMEDQVFGRVMSYSTVMREEGKIEAHNRYVDIQITIDGVEGIDVFDRNGLETKTAYNEEKDVEFFVENTEVCVGTLYNYAGRFSLFYSEDAHRPKVAKAGNSTYVKKCVLKIDRSLYKN